MPVDRRKGLSTAEKLIRQGKVDAALSMLRETAEGSPDDLLIMNRLGDLLARQGRSVEAVGYYTKIADKFAGGGFFPKAAAILKKILRLDPNNVDVIARLGSVYQQQKLHGEARNYLLHAAEMSVREQNHDRAGEIYEQLLEAQPDDLRSRVRLAETRAATGDSARAAEDLLAVGERLLESGETGEAEKIYARARELDPASAGAAIGLANCHFSVGREDEGHALLEQATTGGTTPELAGELALRSESGGRREEAMELLAGTNPLQVPVRIWRRIFEGSILRGDVDDLWSRVDRLFGLQEGASSESLVAILDALGSIEEDGHLPALERLSEVERRRECGPNGEATLKRLETAYLARSMSEQVSRIREELLRVQAGSRTEAARVEAMAHDLVDPDATAANPPDLHLPPETASAMPIKLPLEAEAPAVPLSRSDEEFVAGRITQAEVLEKYELGAQALAQLEEVTAKFPGHVVAQERRVAMLRSCGDKARLGAALVGFAVAQRAAGDLTGARTSAAEAMSRGTLEPHARKLLDDLGLIEAPPVPEQPREVRTAVPESATDDVDIVIDFDGEDEVESVAAPAPAPGAGTATGRPTRPPGDDMLDEISACIEQGKADEAVRRADALRELGYASPTMERLRAQALAQVQEAGKPPAEPREEVDVPAETAEPTRPDAAPPKDREFDDETLTAMAAVLEDDVVEGESVPLVPEEDPEQSFDEILAAFKGQVQEEVGDDAGAHYDLGIAYKEMGLVEEAIQEFTGAADSGGMRVKACCMIALCHRDLGQPDRAAHWYREALAGPADDVEDETLSSLRYDLAEVLLEAGDAGAALEQFRALCEIDPAFRDVQGRVGQLEEQQDS